jgi:hypothetical protein
MQPCDSHFCLNYWKKQSHEEGEGNDEKGITKKQWDIKQNQSHKDGVGRKKQTNKQSHRKGVRSPWKECKNWM